MDATALERQNRRLERLSEQGITRATVLVHQDCKPVFEILRPHFVDPGKAEALMTVITQLHNRKAPTTTSKVRQLSPFRYPGGKTWLVPEIRTRLQLKQPVSILVEPFAGGAIIGLSAAAESLAKRVVLAEIDIDVAAVWQTIFQGKAADVIWLCDQIKHFEVTLENVQAIINSHPESIPSRAFRTIIKNRTQHSGIMATRAGLMRSGERGRGLQSRWYPETLSQRVEFLHSLRDRVSFVHADAFDVIRQYAHEDHAVFFVDPPYTAGGKKAGRRLYTHNDVDHEALFSLTASVRGSVLMTYDDTPEVRSLASQHGFRVEVIPMKNAHHAVIQELLLVKP